MLINLFNWNRKDRNTLTVRVTTKASFNRIKIEHKSDGSEIIKVYVTAAPENSKANKAVIALLSKELSIPKSNLSILHGLTSKDKVIAINKKV